jgi:hypothetical protein
LFKYRHHVQKNRITRTCSENGEQQVTTKILDGTPKGKRSIGRPRLRWLYDDVNYLRNMGVRQWRKMAEDRREWAGIVREATVKPKSTV